MESADFKMLHCYKILKDCPKFAELIASKKAKRKSRSKAQEDQITISDDESSSTGRPIGRKAAKESEKRQRTDADELRKMVEGHEEALIIDAKRFKVQERAEDRKIMSIDVSTIEDPDKAWYFKSEQRKIIVIL